MGNFVFAVLAFFNVVASSQIFPQVNTPQSYVKVVKLSTSCRQNRAKGVYFVGLSQFMKI